MNTLYILLSFLQDEQYKVNWMVWINCFIAGVPIDKLVYWLIKCLYHFTPKSASYHSLIYCCHSHQSYFLLFILRLRQGIKIMYCLSGVTVFIQVRKSVHNSEFFFLVRGRTINQIFGHLILDKHFQCCLITTEAKM